MKKYSSNNMASSFRNAEQTILFTSFLNTYYEASAEGTTTSSKKIITSYFNLIFPAMENNQSLVFDANQSNLHQILRMKYPAVKNDSYNLKEVAPISLRPFVPLSQAPNSDRIHRAEKDSRLPTLKSLAAARVIT
jgi:hypothetical protein